MIFWLSLVVAGAVLVVAFLVLILWLIMLPRRRQERTRLFLHLLEIGMREGMSPQQSLKGLYGCPDKQISHELDEVVFMVSEGSSLSEALRREPAALPPRAVELIAAGERIGNLLAVFPLVQRWCTDETTRMVSALHYPSTLLMVTVPFYFVVSGFLNVVIIPKYAEIFEGMLDGRMLPAFTRSYMWGAYNGIPHLMVAGLFVIMVSVAMSGAFSSRGFMVRVPRLKAAMDWGVFRLPWWRYRFQRDFAIVLGMLIDNGIDEPEAVTLAARGTGNTVMIRRSSRICQQLEQGHSLSDALRLVTRRDDLGWRVATSALGTDGFLATLGGWSEMLGARADRWEQVVAHILSSAIILFVGLLVMTLVIAMWLPLIEMVNFYVLW